MIIKPLQKKELEILFDNDAQNLLKFFLFKALFSQPELNEDQIPNPIQIPKEHIEQWMIQCLGAIPVGAGNYPLDIIHIDKKYGADAKMLAWNDKGKVSNETSLGQKFTGTGDDLDIAFKKSNFSNIVSGWSNLLEKKYRKVKKDYEEIDQIYYFFLIRQNNIFHLCGMEIDIDNLKFMGVERTSEKSIWISNFINSKYGETKIYRSKKRIELRLYPNCWIKDDLVISFDNSNYKSIHKNLIGLGIDDLYEYSLKSFNNFFEEILKKPRSKDPK